jgi:hypothetical protein
MKIYNVFLILLAGENLVSKPPVQMQTTGQRESHGRTKPTQSSKCDRNIQVGYDFALPSAFCKASKAVGESQIQPLQ